MGARRNSQLAAIDRQGFIIVTLPHVVLPKSPLDMVKIKTIEVGFVSNDEIVRKKHEGL